MISLAFRLVVGVLLIIGGIRGLYYTKKKQAVKTFKENSMLGIGIVSFWVKLFIIAYIFIIITGGLAVISTFRDILSIIRII